jgi:hypothetical protein
MAVLAAEVKCRCFRFWAILNALNFIYGGPPTGLTIERGYGPFGPGVMFMRRREFVGLLSDVGRLVRAQQPAKLPTIGFIGPSTASADRTRRAAFAKRLGEFGRVEGRSIAIEISLGGRRRRAPRRDRGRVRSIESRCHRRKRGCRGACRKAGNRCDPNCHRRLCRSGRQRLGGKPGAARRQRHMRRRVALS